jgi:hypothetical protein
MGCRDDADVDADGPLAADTHHFTFLDHAEEPHLRGRRQLADVVEDQRAAISDLDMARRDEGGGLWAIVTDVRVAGAVVKIEVKDAAGTPIQVELGRDRYAELRAIVGETVYVKPRRVRVFVES